MSGKEKSDAIDYREITGEERERKYERLVSRSFGVAQGASFFDDFPVWKENFGAKARRAGIWSGNELAAAACVRLVTVRTPCDTFSAAIIGGVCTDGEWRGRGLASEIVSGLSEWAEDHGAACAFLWGSEHSLYRRLGFELCGRQQRIPLSTLNFGTVPGAIKINRGWNDAVFQCLQYRSAGLVLQNEDIRWMAAHKNVEWRWVGDKSGVKAYAAIGRGIDLVNIVHEWGGDRSALLAIFAELQTEGRQLELLGTPELFTQYKLNNDNSPLESLCMAKVYDPVRIYSAYVRGGKLPDVVASGQNMATVLFGPEAREDVEGLPLPIWIWGLDAA